MDGKFCCCAKCPQHRERFYRKDFEDLMPKIKSELVNCVANEDYKKDIALIICRLIRERLDA